MTSAAVRSAWNTAVFQHASIVAITDRIFQFDITSVIESTPEAATLFYNQQINFFEQIVTRKALTEEVRGNTGTASRYEYDVEVAYYLERDIAQTDHNFNTTLDRLETLDDLVRTQLGPTWTSTVDYWTVSGILKPSLVQIDSRAVWKCGYSYLAVDQI